MKDLTVVIVTYDSEKIIKDCLSRLDSDKYDIIVVDNNSCDNTVLIVQNFFPKIKLIQLGNNIGYGRGNNVALDKINTKFSLVLNPDAFIGGDSIEKVLNLMNNNSDLSLVGPLLLESYPATKSDIEKQLKIVKNNTIESFDNYLSVKYIIGAIVFIRMQAFKNIGFYNEDTFMFYDDDYICCKAIKSGYKCAIMSDINGFHIGGGSSNKNFRNTYKRYLHLFLSKFYWKRDRKGSFMAVKSSIRLGILSLIRSIFYLLTFNKIKLASSIGSLAGCLFFILKLKAFKKNGEARG